MASKGKKGSRDSVESSVPAVAGACTTGGLVGAGLVASASLLPDPWHAYAITVIPAVSSSCALGLRVVAIELQRKWDRRQWANDRADIIAICEGGMPLAHEALARTTDEGAKERLAAGIKRYQDILALALASLPGERLWESQLETLVDKLRS